MARDQENHKRLKREWYLKNIVLTKARAKAWVVENPEKRVTTAAKYRKENADSHNAYNRTWFAENSAKRASYQSKRRAALIQRTPQWLTADDDWIICEAYALAKLRTDMFGFEWHVDHTIPLQGKKVSGLHVPTNLQVIPGAENCRENASFLI